MYKLFGLFLFLGLSILQNGPLPTFIKNFDGILANQSRSEEQFTEGLNKVGLIDVRIVLKIL